jgi:hypothetical protein
MQLKTKSTAKLFYRRWLYKIVVTCGGINHLHRNGLEYVRKITPMASTSQWGSAHFSHTIFSNRDNLIIIGLFLENVLTGKEYQVRAEGHNACIFTNDIQLVNDIKHGLLEFVTEITKPADDNQAAFLLGNKNKIICEEYPHENYKFKIHFKNGEINDQVFMKNFLGWANKYDGKIHIPKGTTRMLDGSSNSYFYGQYYYAKDDKMASMALMFMGSYLNKVEEFVLKRELV